MRRWKTGAALAVAGLAGAVAFMSARPEAPVELPSFDDAPVRIVIDISERRLDVEENGERIESYGVAVGTDQHPTPPGSFAIAHIVWNPRWVPPAAEWAKDERPREPGDPKNPMGRVKMFFRQPDYFIHGTNAETSIGTAASHGCVRMLNDDVIELAQLVMEHGGAAIEPGLIRRLINRVRQTKEVRLGNPVPVRIQA
jgi:lipoprotein-anchoring transpeptidase ErfK/SrfK